MADSGGIVELDARRLRHLRHEAGLTQRELSIAAGIDSNTVSRLERCVTDPHYGTVEALARALSVPPHDLLTPEWRQRLEVVHLTREDVA